MREQLLTLPTTPGTIIAIGDWWLVRLRPYDGAPAAWEMLPFDGQKTNDRAAQLNVRGQCVYGDEWVLSEVEQEGSYLIISEPVDRPYGIKYFSRGKP